MIEYKKLLMDKTMIMEKYLPYKGLWWKITPPINENGLPMWKISEKKDDTLCHVWMFNAFTHSLEDCYQSIRKDFPIEPVSLVDIMKPLQIENNIRMDNYIKMHDFKYIPIEGEYMLGVDVANGFDSDYSVSTWHVKNEDVYELLSVRDCTPKYMGRGFFKVGHIFTNSNGVHLLSILPPSLKDKTYIRYDEEKPKSLDVMYKVICNKLEKFFKNGK